MCGIVGVLGREPVDRHRFQEAVSVLHHRGPDDRGVWFDDDRGVALGHTRLAVIDLSSAGSQPMCSADGSLVLVYNGELYNYREVRCELEQNGVHLKGDSDTEVLLEAISLWGAEAALEKSDGMFAFGLWDRRAQSLTLARDRMGEKPLYYGMVGGRFAFASELSALRMLPGFAAEIDRDALTLLLRHKYIPAPHTIYTGIRKLPPATTLAAAVGEQLGSPQPYWSLFDHLTTGELNDADAIEQLQTLIDRSVAQRVVADVPIGAFLSGGIDSSLVTAAMVAAGGRVNTFTIGFAEADYDESQHARSVADHLGTNHTQLHVSPEMALAVVPDLPRIYDEPFADSSQIPTHLVSKLARDQVTVALSGDGGDELFGGYNRHLWVPRVLARTSQIPGSVRRLARRVGLGVEPQAWDRLAGRLPERVRPHQAGLKIHKAAGVLTEESDIAMLHSLTSHWTDPSRLVIDGTEPSTALTDPDCWPPANGSALRLMTMDAVSYLPDDILVKVDRAAMAVSLETRAPLLARPIVEFAAGLPMDQRIRRGQGKWILREVLARSVPRELFERPKAGFGVPLDSWLRGPLKAWAGELLDPALLQADGFLWAEPVRSMWDSHQAGTTNGAYHLWDVLMFQAWLHDGKGASRV